MSSRVQLKVVLLGEMDCGKTSLVTRYMSGTFSSKTQTTIGAAFCQRNIRIQQKNIKIGIWDTAGMEQFQSMCSQYYKGAQAAVICYDVTSLESFEKADFWIKEIIKMEPDCKVYVCGCKRDLTDSGSKKRAVDVHDASDRASEAGAKFIETSSKTGDNVDQLFLMITQDFAETAALAATALLPDEDETTQTIQLGADLLPKTSKCRC
ncbi:ras-related protein Rab-24-like [Corticium candelabrum]|uniref:ras-related protein Rab-24-like n=1 Tax=Corticium candelabrum TaxID=121492 RepID=UPI002E25926C|nr:ras-related protein Rab-24-like [Corticium candelabrum]